MGNILKDAFSALNYTGIKTFSNLEKVQTVLVYHHLSPQLFRQHMEIIRLLRGRDIVLTFDDGHRDFLDDMFPALALGTQQAIIFISAQLIGSSAEYMSWQQVAELSDAGIRIGSHGITHTNLLELAPQEAFKQIRDSKKMIEDKIGRPVLSFAYPYGGKNAFNPAIKNMVKESGYQNAYSNIMGFNSAASDPFELRRIRIYADDNVFRFKLKVNGGYNWVDKINAYKYGFLGCKN
ncbi:MAG: hypothetical protein COS29_02395 [Candidatus Omnitrophica bacterium CG02_land_8_20_14_3_00__42_8]|nr:MAG: hypothetical protein COS29_02395 [Candidatus Omnitrophica bacterium CG02_land_8_20_14_3_00__42_8]